MDKNIKRIIVMFWTLDILAAVLCLLYKTLT